MKDSDPEYKAAGQPEASCPSRSTVNTGNQRCEQPPFSPRMAADELPPNPELQTRSQSEALELLRRPGCRGCKRMEDKEKEKERDEGIALDSETEMGSGEYTLTFFPWSSFFPPLAPSATRFSPKSSCPIPGLPFFVGFPRLEALQRVLQLRGELAEALPSHVHCTTPTPTK